MMTKVSEEELVLGDDGKTSQAGVISREMLVRLAIKQSTKGTEAGKLFIQDGINLSKIEHIRIEFLNILKIDNLWIMANSLTQLKLSNNAIGKIENLESLVNLNELDLSFNRISVIENLECLVKLEILLLYSNEISTVEGIDALQRLTILSIGANKIDDWDHVMYLRKFRQLRSLNVAGNNCAMKDGYLDYLVAFLPQIVYLNYKMITESDRENAIEKYQRAIAILKEKESVERALEEENKAHRKRQELLSLSYVEYLEGDDLFEKMYQNDKEGRELAYLNDETRTVYEEFKKKFVELCKQLFELGLREQIKRTEEIEMFEKIADEGRQSVHEGARTLMDEIMASKLSIFERIKELLKNRPKIDEKTIKFTAEQENVMQEQMNKAHRLSDEFNDLLSKSTNKLMYREVTLHEQMEDMNETHKANMTDLTSSFIEAARAMFAQMRYMESDYNDNIEGIATIYANTFTDQLKMPSRHVAICGDKDILSNNLASSHDVHVQTIDAREDLMMSIIKNWFDEYLESLVQEENERNRTQVLEISHFLEQQREEFAAIQSMLRSGTGDLIDADIVAVLET